MEPTDPKRIQSPIAYALHHGVQETMEKAIFGPTLKSLETLPIADFPTPDDMADFERESWNSMARTLDEIITL